MMGRCEIAAPSKNIGHIPYIAFVSPSDESTQEDCNTVHNSEGTLSGEEASSFYREIISSPSSSDLPQLPSLPAKKLNSSETFKSSSSFNNRHTIFHYAQFGNLEGIMYCLSQKVDINVQDLYGWTALMCAAFEGHYAVAEYLIKNGANVNLKCKQGKSVFDIVPRNNTALIKLLRDGPEEIVIAKDEVLESKFCNLCNVSYEDSPSAHERSIPHLLNIKQEISTIYHIPENNKGFQILLKNGWDKNKGLGKKSEGRKFPIKTTFKSDRSCIGGKKEVPRITHFGPNDSKSVQAHKQLPLKIKHERVLKKKERQKLEKRERQKEIYFRRQLNDV